MPGKQSGGAAPADAHAAAGNAAVAQQALFPHSGEGCCGEGGPDRPGRLVRPDTGGRSFASANTGKRSHGARCGQSPSLCSRLVDRAV